MNLLPMRYYLSVVKEGGISRAAERLHITQQTLSAHIAALEKELGCPLFERRPRFRLTYAGRVFQDYARRFSELDRAMPTSPAKNRASFPSASPIPADAFY